MNDSLSVKFRQWIWDRLAQSAERICGPLLVLAILNRCKKGDDECVLKLRYFAQLTIKMHDRQGFTGRTPMLQSNLALYREFRTALHDRHAGRETEHEQMLRDKCQQSVKRAFK